jgi:hypothetical protein
MHAAPAREARRSRTWRLSDWTGCRGGDANSVQCNGPNEDADDVKLYHGKGMVSDKLHDAIMAACEFPKVRSSYQSG